MRYPVPQAWKEASRNRIIWPLHLRFAGTDLLRKYVKRKPVCMAFRNIINLEGTEKGAVTLNITDPI
jgi:hypothetical protein